MFRGEAAKPRAVEPITGLGREVTSDRPGFLQSAAEGFCRIRPWVLPVGIIHPPPPPPLTNCSKEGLDSPGHHCLRAAAVQKAQYFRRVVNTFLCGTAGGFRWAESHDLPVNLTGAAGLGLPPCGECPFEIHSRILLPSY